MPGPDADPGEAPGAVWERSGRVPRAGGRLRLRTQSKHCSYSGKTTNKVKLRDPASDFSARLFQFYIYFRQVLITWILFMLDTKLWSMKSQYSTAE